MECSNCSTCKYFAVPLSNEEKALSHCPGADPFGDPAKKICTLKGKLEFKEETWEPESCPYYFPIFMRFR